MVSYLQAFEKDIGFMTDIDELKGKLTVSANRYHCSA